MPGRQLLLGPLPSGRHAPAGVLFCGFCRTRAVDQSPNVLPAAVVRVERDRHQQVARYSESGGDCRGGAVRAYGVAILWFPVCPCREGTVAGSNEADTSAEISIRRKPV